MKKYLLSSVFFLFILFASAQDIKWMSMNEALAAQEKEPKKIMMDVYTKWCGPCKLLDKKTFKNPDVVEYINKNYYAVKFDAEGTEEINYQDFVYTNPNYDPDRRGRNSQHFFAHALKINSYPTIAFFDEKGEVIQAMPGYKTPTQLEIFLKMINNDDYKKLTTQEAWEEYQENFKGKFKD